MSEQYENRWVAVYPCDDGPFVYGPFVTWQAARKHVIEYFMQEYRLTEQQAVERYESTEEAWVTAVSEPPPKKPPALAVTLGLLEVELLAELEVIVPDAALLQSYRTQRHNGTSPSSSALVAADRAISHHGLSMIAERLGRLSEDEMGWLYAADGAQIGPTTARGASVRQVVREAAKAVLQARLRVALAARARRAAGEEGES